MNLTLTTISPLLAFAKLVLLAIFISPGAAVSVQYLRPVVHVDGVVDPRLSQVLLLVQLTIFITNKIFVFFIFVCATFIFNLVSGALLVFMFKC